MKFSVILFGFVCMPIAIFAQDTASCIKNEVLVTSKKSSVLSSSLTRSVLVIDSSIIQNSTDLHSALKNQSGIDIQTRGVGGSQSDVSLRGSTFEQVLILIDGVRINDAQTGHYNLDLPINLSQIERIETLKGNGTQAHGPNAMGGVINIITKKPQNSALNLEIKGGSFHYYQYSLDAAYKIGDLHIGVNGSKEKNDGYTYNTAIDNYYFGGYADMKFGKTNIDINLSKAEKKYGANNFYFIDPNQWEHTKTFFSNLKSETIFENSLFTNSISYRIHDDQYDFLKIYSNKHKIKSINAVSQYSFSNIFGETSISGEINNDELTSTSLGNHNRNSGGLSFEQSTKLTKDLTLALSFCAYNYSKEGWKYLPNIELGYNVIDGARVFSSFGQSFRLPSFTELYYNSKALKGSAELKPETCDNFEIGGAYSDSYISGDAAYFIRNSKNALDWALFAGDSVYRAMNIQDISYSGIEANMSFKMKNILNSGLLQSISLGYSHIESDKTDFPYTPKYSLAFQKNKATIALNFKIIENLNANINFRYEDRYNGEQNALLDFSAKYDFSKFSVQMILNNITDKSYYDVKNVPMPGRNITVGVKYRFSE